MNPYHNPKLDHIAKTLRRNMTKEERHLWYDFLKQLPITVHRQKVIGQYIVEFYIAEAKLVIELDGSQHFEPESLEEDRVRIRGFYPGSFPTGFLGYHAEQVDHTLYVGFKFSALFGIFETGDFDITIPTKGTVTQVVVNSGEQEYTVWPQ